MDGYKAFGSFAPLYIEARRKLIHELDLKIGRIASVVLETLAWHADPIGAGYCGVKRIASESRYAPSSVTRALEVLADMDYIRRIETTDEYGRSRTKWQLSPYVIWISPKYISAAMSFWATASVFTLNLDNLLTNVPQPPEPEIPSLPDKPDKPDKPEGPPPPPNSDEVANQGHAQKSDMPFSQNDAESDGALKQPAAQHKKGKRKAQREAQEQHEVQTSETPGVPPESPVPDNVKSLDFAKYRDPLPSYADEDTANRLARWGGGSRLTQARQMVDTFDRQRVEIGMQLIAKTPGVRNPHGLLKYQLENGLLDKAISPNSTDYFYGVVESDGGD